MSLDKNLKISKTGSSYILYDASIIAEPTLQLFNLDYHTNQCSQQNKSVSHTTGRAAGWNRKSTGCLFLAR